MKDQDMENQVGKSQANQDNTGNGVGISGQNPGKQEGPVAGGNQGNVSQGSAGNSGNANQQNMSDSNSPQGTNANAADTRGADSTDKEFRNNQPNASTLQGFKSKEETGSDNE